MRGFVPTPLGRVERVMAVSQRRPPTRRPAAKKAAPAKRKKMPHVLAGHEVDLIGIVLVVIGALLALALYVNLAGVVGRALATGLGALFGVGRFLLPPLFIGIGVLAVRPGPVADRVRWTVGGVGLTLVVLASLHVWRGPDTFPGSIDAVKPAGGWCGAVLGQPLQAALSVWGAALVLCAVALALILVSTRTRLRDAAGVAAGAATTVGAASARRWRSMSTLRHEFDEVDDTSDWDAFDQGCDETRALGRPSFYDHGGDYAEPVVAAPAKSVKKERPKPTRLEVPTTPAEQLEIDLGPGAQRGQWKLPSLALLGRSPSHQIDQSEIIARGKALEEMLRSFKVETRVSAMTVGPTITRYELELGAGVKVNQLTSLAKDIAYSTAAEDLRILAPIPGKSAIGIEVPNTKKALVTLGDLLTSTVAAQSTEPLAIGAGKDIAGNTVLLDLAKTPHLLVAGQTGAGKSSFINSLVTSILMRTTPDQVRMILIDPKRVEMGQYNDLPHLLTAVVTNPKKASNALQWAVKEMDRRYLLLEKVRVRDIGGYNSAFDRGELRPEENDIGEVTYTYERLPYIVIVVDELNDLMMVAKADVEESITRIAQMARAVGMHLVIATQRPSVQVITGVIKANIPSRIAFAVATQMDSRVILDEIGADRLVGKGDMLVISPANGTQVAARLQGAWVSEEEIRKVTAHWRRQQSDAPQYVDGVDAGEEHEGGDLGGLINTEAADGGDDDEVIVRQAIDVIVRSQLGSTSMLQRKLKVGFARAGRVMDLLEQRGVVGPSVGPKPREVLMSLDEYEALLERSSGR
jgi:DNA segregation ATPase FtsK/SpoIIIE, S-DNA-T family